MKTSKPEAGMVLFSHRTGFVLVTDHGYKPWKGRRSGFSGHKKRSYSDAIGLNTGYFVIVGKPSSLWRRLTTGKPV